jgi:hypothetical protein
MANPQYSSNVCRAGLHYDEGEHHRRFPCLQPRIVVNVGSVSIPRGLASIVRRTHRSRHIVRIRKNWISPGTNAEGAFALAENLREASLATSTAEFGFAVSVSCGGASVGEDGSSREALLKSADDAVYKAKTEGRNRTLRADSVVRVMDMTMR